MSSDFREERAEKAKRRWNYFERGNGGKRKKKKILLEHNQVLYKKFIFTFTETGLRKEPLPSQFKGASH